MFAPWSVSLLLLVTGVDGASSPSASDAASTPDAGASATSAEEAAITRKHLLEEKQRLNQLLDKQQSVLDSLESAGHAVTEAEDNVKLAEGEEKTARQQLARAQMESQAAEAALKARIEALQPRLLARYRLGRGGALALLLGSDSLGDLLWRRRTLNAVLEGDLVLLRAAKEDAERLKAARDEQARDEQAFQQRTKSLAESLNKARQKRDDLSALLSTVENQAAVREKAVAELSRAAARLEALSAPPTVSYSGKSDFEAKKGKLPYPTLGLIEVGFGKVVNPRFNTVVVQKGIDIRAPMGQAVRAIADGTVVYAGSMRGYGNLLLIDHGEGYFTLSAHLRELNHKVGDVVTAGEPIGEVGDTGSLKGPYLYFEVRHHGTPLDPIRWLSPPEVQP